MLDIKLICEMYDNNKSIRDIASIFNTYPNKIARELKKAGKQLRSKEEAAKIAVETGKIKPPMLGKKRTEQDKLRIGTARAKKWASMSDDELESFKKGAKERWDAQSDEDRQYRQQRAGEALRRASVEGSKAERFLYEGLTKLGFSVIMHKTGLIAGEKYEVDLYLPDMLTIIEIDGPQHFLPIYGEDKLQKVIKYDSIKNGALLSKGFCILRVKYLLKNTTNISNIRLLDIVHTELKKIKDCFPSKDKRLIEVEIADD